MKHKKHKMQNLSDYKYAEICSSRENPGWHGITPVEELKALCWKKETDKGSVKISAKDDQGFEIHFGTWTERGKRRYSVGVDNGDKKNGANWYVHDIWLRMNEDGDTLESNPPPVAMCPLDYAEGLWHDYDCIEASGHWYAGTVKFRQWVEYVTGHSLV